MEYFDRYVLLHRIKLAQQISPLAKGEERLRNMREALEGSLEPLLTGQEVTCAVHAIWNWAPSLLKRLSTYFRGVEADLVELCIIPKS